MSIPLDLLMRIEMNTRLGLIGTGTGVNRSVDVSGMGLGAGVSAAPLELAGEGSDLEKSPTSTWVEGTLIKVPQVIITSSANGISHKKANYVIFVKSPKEHGLYYNEAVSSRIEEHFPNNLHLGSGLSLVTVIKTYQQPNIYLDSNTGRFWNRIFVEIESYSTNNQ